MNELPTYLVGVPVLMARCTKCGVATLLPTRPFFDKGGLLNDAGVLSEAGVFSDGCGDCPPPGLPPGPPPASVGVDADGLGPIFIATDHGVIRSLPKGDETEPDKDDETKSDKDDVVFIAR